MRPAPPPSDNAMLGAYRLIGRIGQGGMGTVYLGRSPEGRKVAIKVIRADLSHDQEFRRRFRSEVNRARQVPPFCTAEVLDADPDHDPPYLVVEYVEGRTLAEVINDQGPLRGSALHSLAVGTATALAAIHGAGVIHRDFKPANVLVALGGIKVIDFGIARPLEGTSQHTRTDQMVGTVDYMAPERFDPAAGQQIGPATDVFAWGVVIAYAAIGRTPFAAESPPAVAVRIMTQPPDLSGLAWPLRDLVRRSLAKDPSDRPTARELLTALVTGTGPDTGSAPDRAVRKAPAPTVHARPPLTVPATRATRGRWMIAGVALAASVTAAIVLVASLTTRSEGPDLSSEASTGARAAAPTAAGASSRPTAPTTPAASALPSASGAPAGSGVEMAAIFAGERKMLIYVPRIDRYVTLPLRTDATVSDSTEGEAVFTLFPIGGTTYMIESTRPSLQNTERCVGVKVREDTQSSLRAAECSSTRTRLFEITSTGQTDGSGRPTYLITSDFYGAVGWDEKTLRLSVGERDPGAPRTAFSFVDRGTA